MRFDQETKDLVYRQEVEYAGGMFWLKLLLLLSIALLWFTVAANAQAVRGQLPPTNKGQQVVKNQSDATENNWLIQEQAYTTMKQHVNEAVFKLMDERRAFQNAAKELETTLKNERDYWAAYVKGLDAKHD